MKLRFFAVLALLSLPLPAMAGPREDAISGAARCGSFADDRQWLDCYYGAAQPMRVMLSLAPAPAAQVSLAMAGRGGAPSAAAGPRNDVLSVSSRCASFADNRQWLDCYYGAAQPMRGRLGLAPAAAAQVSLASVARGAAAAASTAPSFGQRRKADGGWFSGWFGSSGGDEVPPAEFGQRSASRGFADDQSPVDHITARMTAYAINKYTGSFVIDLDNGQRWKQLSGDTNLAHWGKKASNYVVNITNGWFGSFNMRVQGEAGVYKVDRVK